MIYYVIKINKDCFYGGLNYYENEISGACRLDQAIIYPTYGIAESELNHICKLNKKIKDKWQFKIIRVHIKFLDHINLLNLCEYDIWDEIGD